MLLGAARAVLARQQATLTLRFSLPTLPPSAVHKLQQTPAAVITGIRFKTTKAAVTTAAAKKTTTVKKTAAPAKKTATAQKKTASTKAATKTAAKKAPIKATTKAKTAGSKSAATRAAAKRAAVSKTPADKTREVREKERAKKAAALQKEREKKAAALQKEREKKAAASQRAKEARERKKAKEAEKKEKARERAKEKKLKEKEKARAQRVKEADARKARKEAEYEKSLNGQLRKHLEASLVKLAPQSPPRAISDNVSNGFLHFMKENAKQGEKFDLKRLREEYVALPESEQKKYLDRALQAREEKIKAYNDWIISIPGKDVVKANHARSRIRNAYKKQGKKAPTRFKKLVDPREPTKPAQPHFLYLKTKIQGTTGNATDKVSRFFKEWKGMTDAQKAPYIEEFQKAKVAFDKAWAAYLEK